VRILIADKFPPSGLERLAGMGLEVTSEPDLKDDALAAALARTRAEILVVRSTRVEERHLDASADLALVIRAGAGYNTIDVDAASRRGIYVANCPGKNSIAVAELAFAHLLAADRRLVDGAADLRAGVWNKKEYSKARGVYGSTLGLLGLGQIGREMVARAHAFGLEVVAWSRSLTPEAAEEMGVEYAASPVEVARRADVLSVHLALTDDTRHLVDAEVLAALPDGALVINTSRGGVIDQQALEQAIRERGLRAALDVFEGEPAAGEGDLEPGLFALPGVQGSHHIGASTEQAQQAVADEVLRIVAAFVEEGEVPNCVNLATKTPATHLLVVRHRDRVGALAGVLDVLRAAEINVQEVENIIFEGAEAACARLRLDKEPSAEVLDQVRGSSDHVLAVTLTAL
jgi:D-3-phosphoglycerate dehydrogenase